MKDMETTKACAATAAEKALAAREAFRAYTEAAGAAREALEDALRAAALESGGTAELDGDARDLPCVLCERSFSGESSNEFIESFSADGRGRLVFRTEDGDLYGACEIPMLEDLHEILVSARE